MKHSINSIKII